MQRTLAIVLALLGASCARPQGSGLNVDTEGGGACVDQESFSDCSASQRAAALQQAEAALAQDEARVASLETEEKGAERQLGDEPPAPTETKERSPDETPAYGSVDGSDDGSDDGAGLMLQDYSTASDEQLRLEIQRLEREISAIKKEIELLEKKIELLRRLLGNTAPGTLPSSSTALVACVDYEAVRAQSGRERVTGCWEVAANLCVASRTPITDASDQRSAVGRVPYSGLRCAQFPTGAFLSTSPTAPQSIPTAPGTPGAPTLPTTPQATQTGCRCAKEQGPWIGGRAVLWCVARNASGNALAWDNVTPSDSDCRATCATLLQAAQCR